MLTTKLFTGPLRATNRRLRFFASSAIAVTIGAAAIIHTASSSAMPPQRSHDAQRVYVAHTTDGDTITIRRNHRLVSVRLIGVDTPETKKPASPVECFGPEASKFTAAAVRSRWVWLQTDPAVGHHDRYGRELAYIWSDSDTLLNLALIAEGYGRAFAFNNQRYQYRSAFESAELHAKAERRGLWGTCAAR